MYIISLILLFLLQDYEYGDYVSFNTLKNHQIIETIFNNPDTLLTIRYDTTLMIKSKGNSDREINYEINLIKENFRGAGHLVKPDSELSA